MSAQAESFDYVIAGGGSAGCVLANRLSADPKVTVCLIEAGGAMRNPLVRIPTAVPLMMTHARMNWRYWSVPQENAGGRRIYVPRGKGLGGSGSINGMVYIRGHRLDYDDWAAAGCEGWSFDEVLPYFRRSERFEDRGDDPFHGTDGEMNVQMARNPSPLVAMMREAVSALQMPLTDGFNETSQEGFGLRQVTQQAGMRVSPAHAFLDPVRRRPNLSIITDATVDRIEIQDGRAASVRLRRGDEEMIVHGRREIILAAGTFGSPAILLRSGIGPGSDLQKLGIESVSHNPGVGANLQDHLTVAVQHVTESTVPFGLSVRSFPRIAAAAIRYLLTREGLFATNVLQAGGYLRSDPALDRSDIQYLLMQVHRSKSGRFGIGHGYGLASVLLRPKSRGSVALAGQDPDTAPLIDFGALNDDRDLDLLVRSIGISRRILAQQAWDPVRGPEYAPGTSVEAAAELEDYVRNTCSTAFHPVGTCRMGVDARAVVDPQLKVKGVAGLRVADASVMPTIIGGNTNAPTIMIAEKAADLILGRRNNTSRAA